MGKYIRILCGMMAVLVAATALGLWQLAEAPQYVAAAESRGQAKPVSFGTDTALVPVHLESQTQEEQLVLRVLAADTEEPVRGALFVVELIDGDGQKTVCKDWDLDGVITTEAMPEGDYTAHLRTLAGFLMPEDTVVTVEPMKREVIDVSDQVVSSDEVDSRTEDGQYGDKKPDDAGSGSSEELPPSIDTPDPEPEPTPDPKPTPDPDPEPTPEPTPVKRGWQTEDGVKYYYSATGERVTGTQVIDGTAYRFTPGGRCGPHRHRCVRVAGQCGLAEGEGLRRVLRDPAAGLPRLRHRTSGAGQFLPQEHRGCPCGRLAGGCLLLQSGRQ